MPKPASDLTELSRLATEMLVASQTATLRMLGMEFQGLVQLIPGAGTASAPSLPSEEEVERGFENMPV